MEWYLKVVRDNYANFEGRARRKEYWMFFLFQGVILDFFRATIRVEFAILHGNSRTFIFVNRQL